MKELINKIANAKLTKDLAAKKMQLVKKRREYNAKRSSLETLSYEIQQLENDIAVLSSKQFRL